MTGIHGRRVWKRLEKQPAAQVPEVKSCEQAQARDKPGTFVIVLPFFIRKFYIYLYIYLAIKIMHDHCRKKEGKA